MFLTDSHSLKHSQFVTLERKMSKDDDKKGLTGNQLKMMSKFQIDFWSQKRKNFLSVFTIWVLFHLQISIWSCKYMIQFPGYSIFRVFFIFKSYDKNEYSVIITPYFSSAIWKSYNFVISLRIFIARFIKFHLICNTFRISDALDLLGFAQIDEKEVHCIASFLFPTTCLQKCFSTTLLTFHNAFKWKYGLKCAS